MNEAIENDGKRRKVRTSGDSLSNKPTAVLAPNSVIGIVGGGQLGRMSAIAAADMGYQVHIFCQNADEPAAQVTNRHTLAPFTDLAALKDFAQAVDVISYEFENIPPVALEVLASETAVYPDPRILRICRNRLDEKSFLSSLKIPTAPFRSIEKQEDLVQAIQEIGLPAILKSAELGYDGKGQFLIRTETDMAAAWDAVRDHAPQIPCILEGFVRLRKEISVIIARTQKGEVSLYEACENEHEKGVLRRTIVPADIDHAFRHQAEDYAAIIAESLNLVGLLAVEMFVSEAGHLLVNEMAPRPHNSGHWSMDGALTSQFEQYVRAICGLPLGSTARRYRVVMENLIGRDVDRWQDFASQPNVKLHLYGKQEIREGRKMGHVNWLFPEG